MALMSQLDSSTVQMLPDNLIKSKTDRAGKRAVQQLAAIHHSFIMRLQQERVGSLEAGLVPPSNAVRKGAV